MPLALLQASCQSIIFVTNCICIFPLACSRTPPSPWRAPTPRGRAKPTLGSCNPTRGSTHFAATQLHWAAWWRQASGSWGWHSSPTWGPAAFCGTSCVWAIWGCRKTCSISFSRWGWGQWLCGTNQGAGCQVGRGELAIECLGWRPTPGKVHVYTTTTEGTDGAWLGG